MSIDPAQIFIYHITHIKNLPGIITTEGLCSDSEIILQDKQNMNIAHSNIKERRRNTSVPVCQKGVVADYVPFYFCSRSPMLFSIHQGRVEGYAGGQKEVVYLCSKLITVINGTRWCFSDGHTDISAFCNFFDNIDDFSKLDWGAIKDDGWGYPYYTSDSDLKRRKQAEFLVHKFFPWHFFVGIGVFDENKKNEVESYVENANHKPQIKVIRKWYY